MIDSVSESSAWSEIIQLSLGKIHPIKNWSAQFHKSNSRFLINFHFVNGQPCLKNSQHDRKSIPQAAGYPEFQHHFKDLFTVTIPTDIAHNGWHIGSSRRMEAVAYVLCWRHPLPHLYLDIFTAGGQGRFEFSILLMITQFKVILLSKLIKFTFQSRLINFFLASNSPIFSQSPLFS